VIRQALFYGTLGAIVLYLVVDGYRTGGEFGVAEMVVGALTAMLTLRVILDEGREASHRSEATGF
jgi:hypothetical protein